MRGKTNSQVGGGIKGEKVNISLLTNQPEHSALMGAAITVKYGESETQYVWEGVSITVTIPPYEDYEVSVSGVAGYKTPEVFTATAQADNARSLNFEYKAERVKVTLSAVGGADMNGTTVNIYGQEYTFSGTPIEVLVPFDETYSVQGGAFGSAVAPLAQSFTASIPLREINLEYRTCVLVVNMLSNQVSDATIAALKASVTYGSTTIEVANGIMVDIPSGMDITIMFPEVENYNTPSAITFTSVNGINTQSATYVTERVIVNASGNDGGSVDGVTASVVREVFKPNTNVPNGIYIQDIEGRCWLESEWDGSKTPNGIAVVTDNCRFVMALSWKKNIALSTVDNYLFSNIDYAYTESEAISHRNGKDDCEEMISQLGLNYLPAIKYCKGFTFPNGQKGYLGAAGEWNAVKNNISQIQSALKKCGSSDMAGHFWTTTQYYSYLLPDEYGQMWTYYRYNTSSILEHFQYCQSTSCHAYPFTSFSGHILEITKGEPEEKEIVNGKAEFKVAHGLEYDVMMSDKHGYKTPAKQSFVADSVSRNVPMVYEFSGFKLNILSNQDEDALVAAVKASVSVNDVVTEVGNGKSVKLNTGDVVTIIFPNIEGYKTPEPISFTHDGNSIEKTATYYTERVTVNVTSNDGSGAEGQLVNVTTQGATEVIPNGVYIEDIDGYLWPTDMWNNKATPNGIAVVSDECSFVIALSYSSEDVLFRDNSLTTNINGITICSDENSAKQDFDGLNNTEIIANLNKSWPAADNCYAFRFPNGQAGYLGSAGEWDKVLLFSSEVEYALSLCNGAASLDSSISQSPAHYWTSTPSGAVKAWSCNIRYSSFSSFIQNDNIARARPFTTVSATTLLTGDKIDSRIVKGGKAEFNMAFGTEYTVSVNEKAGYVTPQAQVFTANTASRSIAMEYQLSGLKLNIASNQGNNDTALDNVKALVTYGSNSVELGNGESLGLSASTEVTITFPDVPDYKTPEPISFTHVDGFVEKSVTYLTEKVVVSLSANDGSSVDGEVVTVVKSKKTLYSPAVGVYIQSIDGVLYTEAEWDGTKVPNGIAVVTSNCQFVMGLKYLGKMKFGAHNRVSGVVNSTNSSTAYKDYAGESNTDKFIEQLKNVTDIYATKGAPAAEACKAYVFPNGQSGYLPAIGEWNAVKTNQTAVTSAFVKCNRTFAMNENWSSTCYKDEWIDWGDDDGYQCYYMWISGGGWSSRNSESNNVLPFAVLKAYREESTTEDYEVVNSTVTIKVAHGMDYSISASSKEGYKSLPIQKLTSQLNVNNISLQYEKIVATDLSMRDVHGNKIAQSTANCYVVSQPGSYKIPIAYGAAIKNGEVNSAAYTNNGGANSHDFVNYLNRAITSPYVEEDTGLRATSVQMSISDTQNAVTNLTFIGGAGCRYISFDVPSIPDKGGNAVISILDEGGNIMWNWHIWLWEDDLHPIEITNDTGVLYNIMPCNLGSLWYDTAKSQQWNWFYQFGRPVPLFYGGSESKYYKSYGALGFSVTTSGADNLSYGFTNPATYYYGDRITDSGWYTSNAEKRFNLWNAAGTTYSQTDSDMVKTVYDPCPAGWKVPNGNIFTGFGDYNYPNYVKIELGKGIKLERNNKDETGVMFPFSGQLYDYTGTVGTTRGRACECWLAEFGSTRRPHYFRTYYDSDYDDVQAYTITNEMYTAKSIRPVLDTPLTSQSKITKIRIDQTMKDPENMITRTVDLGGIEAIKANSHRYRSSFDGNGNMLLRQLQDTDGTKYLDGSAATLTTVGTDVWMKLPQFYWKCEKFATDIWDFTVAYGVKPDETFKEWDGKDLIGVYEAYSESSKLYSVSGKDSTGLVSQANFKTYARARGEGFSLVKWKHHCMMAMLYYTMYGNTNCQAKIGKGTDSISKTTGATNSLGMTDTVAGGNGDSNSINFWGLENWWGNKYEYIDNVTVDALLWKVTEDDGTVRQAGTGDSYGGWTSKLLLGENIDLIPTDVSGSETTGFCDYYYQSSSTSRVVVRSYGFADTYCGVAFVYANQDSSYENSYYGSRLAYRGDYQIID